MTPNLEQWTRDLREHGYRPSVAARKLIEEQSIDREEAVRIVQNIYGKNANPYALESTYKILVGVGILALGLGSAAWPFILGDGFHHGWASGKWDIWDLKDASLFVAGGLVIAGGGAVRIIFAVVNHGAEQPYRPSIFPREGE